jgi:hypothetical protein
VRRRQQWPSFVDGFNSSAAFQLVELPKGSSSFENISGVSPDGNVQWDGNYLTIGCGGGICRYRVVGTKAILKGIVPVSGCTAYWIARPYVCCADAGNNDGEVFKYPVGGSPIATLGGSFDTLIRGCHGSRAIGALGAVQPA